MYKTFETERLILRPTDLEDAEFILALLNTPKWLQFIGDRNIHDVEDAIHYINSRVLYQYERLGYGNYTVIRKEDGVKIGSCGLYDREGLEGIDIGFAFFPEYEGKGYGFEAASRMLKAAVEDFSLKKIKAITNLENYASQKLLEKIGLVKVDKIKMHNDELFLFELNV